jgi:hypothetical protein
MIGDASARGKRGNTTKHGPEYKKKNSEGRSYKHVPDSKGKNDTDSGGDSLTRKTARAMHSAGPLQKSTRHHMHDKQAPHKQKERKETKHIDQGDIINEWCRGQRGNYR